MRRDLEQPLVIGRDNPSMCIRHESPRQDGPVKMLAQPHLV